MQYSAPVSNYVIWVIKQVKVVCIAYPISRVLIHPLIIKHQADMVRIFTDHSPR